MNFDNMRPARHKLLILPIEKEAQTEGGLAIPERHREERAIGTVLHAGADTAPFGAGDTVFWPKFQGAKIETRDGEWVVLHMDNVLAYIPAEVA